MTPVIALQSGNALALAAHACPAHMSYAEAGVVGLIQGVSELFPISSLGHNVLIPALAGGCWAQNLNVATPESPYLAFIVGMHVATALAMIISFWRDWVRIIGAFFGSLGHLLTPALGVSRWQMRTADEKLAWMLVLASIPVGIAGVAGEHAFRVLFGHAVWAAVFLVVNGLILLAAEAYYRAHPPSPLMPGTDPVPAPVPELVPASVDRAWPGQRPARGRAAGGSSAGNRRRCRGR